MTAATPVCILHLESLLRTPPVPRPAVGSCRTVPSPGRSSRTRYLQLEQTMKSADELWHATSEAAITAAVSCKTRWQQRAKQHLWLSLPYEIFIPKPIQRVL
jgi:hypothetical protein